MADAKAGNACRPVLDATGRDGAGVATDELTRGPRLQDAGRFWFGRSLELARTPHSDSLEDGECVGSAPLAAAPNSLPASEAVKLASRSSP